MVIMHVIRQEHCTSKDIYIYIQAVQVDAAAASCGPAGVEATACMH